MDKLTGYLKTITDEDPVRIVLSKPIGDCEFNKIIVTDKVKSYQAEKFTERQVFHQNVSKEGLFDYLCNQISTVCIVNILNGADGCVFLHLNSFHDGYGYSVRITKKGKVFFTKSKMVNTTGGTTGSNTKNKVGRWYTPSLDHNRQKNYIFKEGEIIEPLIDMGIFTKEGRVVQSMYDKFRQINRFIEMVDDVFKANDVNELSVVDFGCGKSYLTFLLYYYFRFIKRIKIKMIGLDLNEDVIVKCNLAAQKYDYANLSFRVGDIRHFDINRFYIDSAQPDSAQPAASLDGIPQQKAGHPIDMVISLHACDTATDYALLNAVKWDVKTIFAVPCCQHEFNQQIASERFSIVTRYGIIKEHIAAALTDAVRANLLLACGYKTQLLEFIDSAHTPKNILIRAVQSNISKETRYKALDEVKRLISEFGLEPALLTLLQNEGIMEQ